MESLIKIPCILVAIVGIHTATTPPQPPPNVNETAPSTKLEGLVKVRWGPIIVKTICWIVAVAETAVILAAKNPKLSISHNILANLMLSGSADSIRPTPIFFFGTFLAGLGGYIRYSCYRALGRFFTFEMSIRKGHQLITNGPYRVVRHPAYTGIILSVTGLICCHSSSGSWARESGVLQTRFGQSTALLFISLTSTLTSALLLRMSKEDAALRKEFGNQWDNWARIVPYNLIPWIY